MITWTIAGLAREAGIGVETVRFYQRRGLLEEPERPGGPGSAGGFRRYGEVHAERLRFIRAAKTAGFTLAEIAELLRLDAVADRARARADPCDRGPNVRPAGFLPGSLPQPMPAHQRTRPGSDRTREQ